MNFNYLLLSITILSNTRLIAGYTDYVQLVVHNYTIDPVNVDGTCSENMDTYLEINCGSATHYTDEKSNDNCYDKPNKWMKYTGYACTIDDTFSFEFIAHYDCDGSVTWFVGECGDAADFTLWPGNGEMTINDYECGWNGPLISENSANDYSVAYSLYVPCEPTVSPTPSPTTSPDDMYFTICLNNQYSFSTTNDADQIKVRLWTDDESSNYKTEWRYISFNDSTIFNDTSSGNQCHSFWTFNDIYYQWYLMDLSICSTDGVLIDTILFWDKSSSNGLGAVPTFSGDSDCIKLNGDSVLLDGNSIETYSGYIPQSKTSTDCQIIEINLSYGTDNIGEIEDRSTDSNLDDGSDNCTSL